MPEINAYTGPPRQGKSYAAMRKIVEELAKGEKSRWIYTNLAVNHGAINELFAKLYPDVELCLDRLVWLTHEEMRHCYTHRGPGIEWTRKTRAGRDEKVYDDGFLEREYCSCPEDYPGAVQRQGRWMTHLKNCPSVLLIVDEAHEVWYSREWQEFGASARTYFSKACQLGDDVIYITHAVSDVDAYIVRKTQLFYEFTNGAKNRFAGIFRSLPGVRWMAYAKPPGEGTAGPQIFGTFLIKAETIGQMYDTSNTGKAIDREAGHKVKGLPAWSAVVMLLLALWGINAGVEWAMMKFRDKALGLARPNLVGPTNVVAAAAAAVPSVPVVQAVPTAAPPVVVAAPSVPVDRPALHSVSVAPSRDVWITGVAGPDLKGKVWVLFSDGVRCAVGTPEVPFLKKDQYGEYIVMRDFDGVLKTCKFTVGSERQRPGWEERAPVLAPVAQETVLTSRGDRPNPFLRR